MIGFTAPEQSNLLDDAGIKAKEDHHFFWWRYGGDKDNESREWELVTKKDPRTIDCDWIAAYTFDELWAMLPDEQVIQTTYVGDLMLGKPRKFGTLAGYLVVTPADESTPDISVRFNWQRSCKADTPTAAAVKLILKLIEEGVELA